jgi:hypothetical protein
MNIVQSSRLSVAMFDCIECGSLGPPLYWDVRELDVAALSPFLYREVLDVDVPRKFSRSICVYHTAMSRWRESKLDEDIPQVLGDLGD